MIESKVFQVLSIAHHDMHHEVVTAADEERKADFRYLHNIVEEPVDGTALVLGQFDHEQSFEPNAERLRIDLDMGALSTPASRICLMRPCADEGASPTAAATS